MSRLSCAEIRIIKKSDSQLLLQSTISSKAAILSQESLKLIQLRDEQSGSEYDKWSDLEILATQVTFIFEISVRLAIISSKYSLPTKSPKEALPSALHKLKEVFSRIEELGSFVRHIEMKAIEMSSSTTSTQN